jgi:hypothetical protein
MLRDVDLGYLAKRGLKFSTYPEGNLTLLVLEGYKLPAGYAPQTVDLLIQIPADYPDAALDMWWVYPQIQFERTGAEPINTTERASYVGFTPEPNRLWQRFSRHPQWRLGVDDLRSYIAAIRSTMENEVRQLTA